MTFYSKHGYFTGSNNTLNPEEMGTEFFHHNHHDIS